MLREFRRPFDQLINPPINFKKLWSYPTNGKISHQYSLCIHNLFYLKFKEMNVILLMEEKTQYLN
jgi:hypothetical protein